MNRFKFLCVGLLCVSSAAGAAELQPAVFEATLFGGYRFGGTFDSNVDESSRKLKDGESYGITLNIEQMESAYYEFTYSRQDTVLQGGEPIDLSVEYFHLGGLLEFADEGDRAIPYFAMTVGATRFAPGPSDLETETVFSLGMGGGVKIPLARHFALRIEGRGYLSFLDSNSTIFCVSGSAGGSCAVKVSGDAFFQGQALLGVTFSF